MRDVPSISSTGNSGGDRTLPAGLLLLPAQSHQPPSIAKASSAAELAHDARSLIAAVNVYCELLSGPGVLGPGFRHYAEDLRRVGQTGARLLETLAGSLPPEPSPTRGGPFPAAPASEASCGDPFPAEASLMTVPRTDAFLPERHCFPPIDDLAAEVDSLKAPLRALAGPGVRLEVECAPCAGLLGLNPEDLLRILFNLVANAVEAMSRPSMPLTRRKFLRITVQRGGGASFLPGAADGGYSTVVLSVRDNGPGISPRRLDRIFTPGFSTRPREARKAGGAARAAGREADPGGNSGSETCVPFTAGRDEYGGLRPRGLGLAIVRRLVEGAGGAVRAVSSPGMGARFDIELPILSAGRPIPRAEAFPAATAPVSAGDRPSAVSAGRNGHSQKIVTNFPRSNRQRGV